MHASIDRVLPASGRPRPRLHPVASGAFLALAPAPLTVVRWVYTEPGWIVLGLAAVAGLAFLAAGWTIVRFPRPGRILGTAALLGLLSLAAPRLVQAPGFTLLCLLVATLAIATLWNFGAIVSRRPTRRSVHEGRTHGAALAALALWVLASLVSGAEVRAEVLGMALSFAVVAVLALRWMWRAARFYRVRALVLLLALLLAGLLAFELRATGWPSLLGGVGFALAALLAVPRQGRAQGGPSDWSVLLDHPERLLVGTFGTLVLLGTLVLALPRSATVPGGVGLMDAAFTAVSAVCVTGLIVRDTPNEFSLGGQAAILLLIQLGGLGIMTFSTAAFRVFGRRMSLRHEGAVARLLSAEDRSGLSRSAVRILQVTVVAEALGAIALTVGFLRAGDAIGVALWRGVFTAISAFCNAGFALQTDSLVPYQQDPLVLCTVAGLILLGGLSPVAVLAVPRFFRRPARPVPAEIRLAFLVTGVLLVLGTFFVLALEWNHTLRQLGLGEKLLNAWFQSVTLRTAGFNSIDFTALQPATVTLMMFWMFVGGSPGSTAGGIKTTTAALLGLAVIQAVRGNPHVVVFGRTISERSMRKAAVVATLGLVSWAAGVVALHLTQAIEPLAATFETVSALGTVGLSVGATAQLDGVGKIIIMICMFAGRVGALSLLMFLSSRVGRWPIRRPEEDVAVG